MILIHYQPILLTMTSANICPLLTPFLSEDVYCRSVKRSFSKPEVISERFSASSTYQLYSRLDTLQRLQIQIARNLCQDNGQCIQDAATLGGASVLDMDFDAISHAITVTAYWTKEGVNKFPESHKIVRRVQPQDSVEVGILQAEKADEPEEIKFGGWLTVLGDRAKPGGFERSGRRKDTC